MTTTIQTHSRPAIHATHGSFAKRDPQSRRRVGATMVLVVVLLPVLFALSALAINIAYMESANTGVQVAVDAAARAAGRTYALTGDVDAALAAAQEAAARNPFGDFVVPIAASDLDIGSSVRHDISSPYVFTESGDGEASNSLRLTTRMLASGNADAIDAVFPLFNNIFSVRPLRTAISTQGVIDIALVIDRSGSMAYASDEIAQYPPAPSAAPSGWDFGDACPPNARWLDLIASVATFNDELDQSPQQEHLALITYNHEARRHMYPQPDYDLVLDELNQISVQFDSGGTAIGSGIYHGVYAVANSYHARPHASKVVIVMTDGAQNYGSSPQGAAQYAARKGVTLFTVTFSDEAEIDAMEEVASLAGGEHFHAATADQLREAFRSIARRLPTMLTH
ncbi:von Willebrand factor type A domain protein [Rubripirellula lacrimiformis]|uniref:von Willebrand factor type A domain protein n=1 Tax=Rubripirellula lacrimiformis TaxID=1930273 RepID=A0A517NBZ8_9BACT|nr:VWA domain-containing protein [Rubripirellula lacrimiformis]QDT04538.1 von Willebrand factor type A domain protein [Rubripirellula lacrimiformis]